MAVQGAGEQDRGLLLPSPSCRGARLCLLPATVPPPPSSLTASAAPPACHIPGRVLPKGCSGRHQHHWPGLRAALQTVPQEHPGSSPHDRCAGEAGGGEGSPTPGAPDQNPKRRPALPQSSSERAGKWPACPCFLLFLSFLWRREGAPWPCPLQGQLFRRAVASCSAGTSSLSLARRASTLFPAVSFLVCLCASVHT